jgi:hypothetical protein
VAACREMACVLFVVQTAVSEQYIYSIMHGATIKKFTRFAVLTSLLRKINSQGALRHDEWQILIEVLRQRRTFVFSIKQTVKVDQLAQSVITEY